MPPRVRKANAAAPLAILVALGGALALAGPGGKAETRSGGPLPAGTAVMISAPAPAHALPGVIDDPTLHPALSAAFRRSWSAVKRAGVDPNRGFLAEFSFLTVAVERSCPPPALHTCRPAIRVTGRLGGDPPPILERNLSIGLVAGLRAAGYRPLSVHRAPGGELSGRVSSNGEALARWRRSGEVIEIVTGGLEPRVDVEQFPDHSTAGGGSRAATRSELRVDTNPEILEALLR